MSTGTVVLALVLGFGAGALSGLFGVGGGILFVPTLVFVVGLGQLGAQATSLAAMIPVVAFGAWQQHRVGNVRWRAALGSDSSSLLLTRSSKLISRASRAEPSLPTRSPRRSCGISSPASWSWSRVSSSGRSVIRCGA